MKHLTTEQLVNKVMLSKKVKAVIDKQKIAYLNKLYVFQSIFDYILNEDMDSLYLTSIYNPFKMKISTSQMDSINKVKKEYHKFYRTNSMIEEDSNIGEDLIKKIDSIIKELLDYNV